MILRHRRSAARTFAGAEAGRRTRKAGANGEESKIASLLPANGATVRFMIDADKERMHDGLGTIAA